MRRKGALARNARVDPNTARHCSCVCPLQRLGGPPRVSETRSLTHRAAIGNHPDAYVTGTGWRDAGAMGA